MNFTQNERKVLKYLTADGRATDMDIAKELDISSQAVGKIRKKLESEGVITCYETRLNCRKLGINTIVITKVRPSPALFAPEAAVEFFKGLQKVPYIVDVFRTPNQELILVAAFRNLKEHDLFSAETMKRYGRNLHPLYSVVISGRGLLKHDSSELMGRLLDPGTDEVMSVLERDIVNQGMKIDPVTSMTKNEKKVLNCLIEDGRATDMDMAKKLSISSQAVGKIRKKLESEGVIDGYYAKLDLEKMGISTLVLAKLKTQPELFNPKGPAAAMDDMERNYNIISAYRSAVNDLVLLAGFRNQDEFDRYAHKGLEDFNKYVISLDVDSFSSSAILKDSRKQLFSFVVDGIGEPRKIFAFPDQKEGQSID